MNGDSDFHKSLYDTLTHSVKFDDGDGDDDDYNDSNSFDDNDNDLSLETPQTSLFCSFMIS